MLADASGGGQDEARIAEELARLDQVVAALNLLATAAGAMGAISSLGGLSLGIVAAYGQRLARLYAAASMSIILMDPSGIEPAVRLAVATMACEVVKNIALTAFSGAGRVAGHAVTTFATIDGIGGLGGGIPLISCPI